MRVSDLFAGWGGFSEGAEAAGCDVARLPVAQTAQQGGVVFQDFESQLKQTKPEHEV